VQEDLVKRMMYAALLAGAGALASLVANRIAAMAWRRVFGEDPPE